MVDFILWAFCSFKYSPEINALEFNKKIPLFKDSTNKKEIIEIQVVTVQYSVNPLQNKQRASGNVIIGIQFSSDRAMSKPPSQRK